MSTAPDTGPERMAEYERLFTQALIGREKTEQGIRFRFRAEQGIEDWVGDLAAREKACCPFLTSTITRSADQVRWDITTIDDDLARAVLAEYYALPDTIGQGVGVINDRLDKIGLRVIGDRATADLPTPSPVSDAAAPEQ
ncbi:hypothetical protein [Actinomadura sp. SCN-SB]|uniref:hypothetical protein n=1 Tax=Actinomadura sp. SCN-SB TaxID=3373092 RepID=UPI0037519B00